MKIESNDMMEKAVVVAIVLLFVAGAFFPATQVVSKSSDQSRSSHLSETLEGLGSPPVSYDSKNPPPPRPLGAGDPWWNPGWQYRKEITINHLKVGANLVNFPVLVSLASDADLVSKAQGDGDDIVFTSKTRTKLNHEIEMYNGTTNGRLVAWVNVTSLSSTADTTIYMYYGNPSCGNQQNSTGAWDTYYRAVWHLKEDPGVAGPFGIKDSTSYGNHGFDLTASSMNSADHVPGKIGYGIDFDGTNDIIKINNSWATGHNLDFTTGPFTLEAWFNSRTFSTSKGTIVSKRDDTSDQYQLYIESNGNHINFRTGYNSGGGYGYGSDSGVVTNTWYHGVCVFNASRYPNIFRDGVKKTWTNSQGSVPYTMTRRNVNVSIGARWQVHPTTGYQFDGILDEVRISSTERSQSWLTTCYNNTNNPASFYTLGSEETRPVSPQISNENPANGATGVSLNPTLAITVSDPQGETMNITFKTNATGSWTTIGSNMSVGNGTYRQIPTVMNTFNTKYFWSVNATNGIHWTNKTYWFVTKASTPPSVSNENPANQTTGVILNPPLSIQITDSQGDPMNVWFKTNATGSWATIGSNVSVGNGTYRQIPTVMNTFNTKYYWSVNVTDGTFWTNKTYWFITKTNTPPTISNPSPANGSTNVLPSISQLSVQLTDADSDLMDYTIQTSPNIGSGSGTGVGNGVVSLSVSGLAYGTTYYWYVNATDGYAWARKVFWFTTKVNTPPAVSSPSPANGSTNVLISLSQVSVQLTDADSDLMDYTIQTSPNIGSGSGSGVGNGVVSISVSGLAYLTTYTWYVNATDSLGSGQYTRKWYTFTTRDVDHTPPSTPIVNFAGNPGDSGGPKWRPDGESVPVANGYYTPRSQQQEDWIFINATCVDETSLSHVYLQWYNSSSGWTNDTYELTHTTGNYYVINTSGIIATQAGHDYSFDITAVDGGNNRATFSWKKEDEYNIVKRYYVQLHHTANDNISYSPYYLVSTQAQNPDAPILDTRCADAYYHAQATDGTENDVGYMSSILPSNVMHEKWCDGFTAYWFNDNVTIPPTQLKNVYFHEWLSHNPVKKGANEPSDMWFGTSFTRDYVAPDTPGADYKTHMMTNNNVSKIYYDSQGSGTWHGGNDTFLLYTGRVDLTTPYSLTDNNVYQIDWSCFIGNVYWSWSKSAYPITICNRSILSYVIFNLPSNSTLQGQDTDADNLNDYQELYTTYTSPFIRDTDNDGITDYWESRSGSDPNNYTETYNITFEPVLSNVIPSNGSTGVLLNPTLSVSVFDYQGDLMNIWFTTNATGSWTTIGTNMSVGNGTYRQKPTVMNAYSTKYYWRVNATDGTHWINRTYWFVTKFNATPVITSPNPANQSINTAITLSQLSVQLNDPDNDLMDYTIQTSPNIGSGSGTGVGNGVVSISVSGLTEGTTYYWYVNATDPTGSGQWTRKTYWFRTTDTWWNTDWAYRKQIIIDHTKVAANLVNFPVLINLPSDGNLSVYAQDDGDDLVFTTMTGVKLHHEIEYFNGTTGRLVAWMNVTSLSSTTNTILYLYYGNLFCANQQNPTAVWDAKYVAVWHLREDPGIAGTGGIKDSTKYHNNGTALGAMNVADHVSGKIGYAIDFDGSNDTIRIDNSNTIGRILDITSGPLTLEAWFRSPKSADQGTLISKRDGVNLDQYQFYAQPNLQFRSNQKYGGGTDTLYANTWYYGAAVVDGTGWPETFRDGVLKTPWAGTGIRPYTFSHYNVNVSIGARWQGYPTTGYPFNGTIDEVRISKTNRSSGWLLTSYNNQNNPSSFHTLGSEEIAPLVNHAPVFSGANPADNTGNVPINYPSVNVTIRDREGEHFNWTIQGQYVTSAGTTGASNGSKSTSLLIPLPYATNIIWYVNATDGQKWTRTVYNFTTRAQYIPNPPSGLTATAISRSRIDLGWTTAGKADKSIIERNLAASWSRGEGTLIYNDTGASHSDTGLLQNTRYYYQAWSWNQTDHIFSTTSAAADATTLPNAPPVAAFTYEPGSPMIHGTVFFNSTSYDTDGSLVNWSWDFGDSHIAYGERVTHQFANNQSYTVRLTVRDNETATTFIQHVVTVVPVIHVPVKRFWNLISAPFNETIHKTRIVVSCEGTNYSWTAATTGPDPIILGTLYRWNKTAQTYESTDTFSPGQGYWMWTYYNCTLVIPGNETGGNHVASLAFRWNIPGNPYNMSLEKEDITVYYNGTNYTWQQATTGSDPIILGFLYRCNRTTQVYEICDYLEPEYGYWMYAYHACALKREI